MKIQQSTPSSYTHAKKPNSRPQQSTPVSVDTVEIGKRTASMEADIGKLYAQYRTSNSQYDQNYLKREMLATLDSGNAALAKKEKLKELLTRLFNKNDRAWSLKEQIPTSHPKTETEFHQQKHTGFVSFCPHEAPLAPWLPPWCQTHPRDSPETSPREPAKKERKQ